MNACLNLGKGGTVSANKVCVHTSMWSGSRGSEGHSWEELTAKLTGREKNVKRNMAAGTESRFTCQSFLLGKPKSFREKNLQKQSLGACWVCRYNFFAGAVCGQHRGWEVPRRSGELHSNILIAQGAQCGQKTLGHGRCSDDGDSMEDNTDCQQHYGL